MNRRQIKKEILALLQNPEMEYIYRSIVAYPQHLVLNTLFIALCNSQENIRWNGVSCFGRVVPAMAEGNIESARVVMRRFLWSLNDESGGIGWGAPEAMAEIMCHNSQLRSEYLHMLISYIRKDGEELFQDGNYIELPVLQRGILWGIGRLCQLHKDEMVEKEIVGDITAYLDSPDQHVSGLALRCLSLLGSVAETEKIKKMSETDFEFQLFVDNKMKTVKSSQFAKNILG